MNKLNYKYLTDMKALKYYLTFLLFVIFLQATAQRPATISEKKQNLKTYPFSDPNPISNPDNSYYPYFRFDGFAKDAVNQEWNVVDLENDYIKVSIFPEIGGKIWGAIEKSTGHEFIYYNSVVKYRDIAMRGAWTSGGIELNFGIIGHAPTSATPVDYSISENEDGSVSCFLSATDLLTRTRWETEVNLPKDKAFFTTNTTWHNPTPLVQPYYQWMNAAYQVEGNMEFCFPGSHWIGHDGGAHSWPVDPEGRDRSWYKNNSFGGSKSNHVLGGISDHYAGYWHDLEFGSGHYSPYGEKLGMKVFQWAHSRSGGIWEDLLTDTDGQYVELQSGRLFNQAVPSSTKTPFKHHGFESYATDVFKEFWFPILKTKGVKKANQFGVLNIEEEQGGKTVYFCPLQKINDVISIYEGGTLLKQFNVELDVLETWSQNISSTKPLKIVLGNNTLTYSEQPEDNISNRPMEAPEDFDWESSYGKYLDGKHWIYQRKYELAKNSFESCIDMNPYFAPAHNQLAFLYYRKAAYQKALEHASTSLSINAYDAEANFVYGLINKKLDRLLDARDGYSVASLTPSFRKAAHIELSKLSLKEGKINEAKHYARKILDDSGNNIDANKLMAIISRKTGKPDEARKYLDVISSQTRLDHFIGVEQELANNAGKVNSSFIREVQCELPNEILMELALWYKDLGCIDEAIQLLALSPESPLSQIHLAYLFDLQGNSSAAEASLKSAMELNPDHVSPFRPEDDEALTWAVKKSNDWLPKYYQGLLHWSLGKQAKAQTVFTQIGDSPDYAPFYVAKSQLFSKNEGYDAQKDLVKALDLDGNQWRSYAKLVDYYLSKNNTVEALKIAKNSTDRFPANNVLKYNYARCLMADGQYSACKKVLATTVILPSEGARYGRVTYQQSCLMEALDYYESGKYSTAIKSLGSARLWPENLGVGKPFVVDERIEDYVEAMCLLKKGKKKQAAQYFQKVVDYNQDIKPRFSSVDYTYLKSLKQMGNDVEVKQFLERWEHTKKDDPLRNWCIAMLDGDLDKAQTLAGEINTKSGGTPWDPKYADPEFEIVKVIGNLN